MLSAEMFFLKLPSLMPGLQNLCSACKWIWFLCEMWPVLVISNAVTDACKCEMYVRKCDPPFIMSRLIRKET